MSKETSTSKKEVERYVSKRLEDTRVSRRVFLSGIAGLTLAAVGGAVAVLDYLDKPSLPISPITLPISAEIPKIHYKYDINPIGRYVENEEAENLRIALEKKYGVEIITVAEIIERNNGLNSVPDLKQTLPKWSVASLQMLDFFLNKLPRKIYQLGEKEQSLQLVLSANPYSAKFSVNDSEPSRIELSYPDFTPDKKQASFANLNHQLTRMAVESQGLNIWRDRVSDIASGDRSSSRRINDITAGAFDTFRAGSYERVKFLRWRDIPFAVATSPIEPDKIFTDQQKSEYFYRQFLNGLGYNPQTNSEEEENWMEFLPIAAEFYIQGKNQFYELYSDVMSQKQVDKLYKYLNDFVFYGQEF